MAVGSYAQSELNTEVTAIASGSFSAANFLTVANRAVRDVLLDIDMRSAIRSAALSPNLFDDIYQYSAPASLKGNKIIDIKPQINRGRFDRWDLVTAEEFDRKKQDRRYDKYGDQIELKGTQWLGDNLVAIFRDDLVNKLLLSKAIDDKELVIDTFDAVGDWDEVGDGDNITADADNYVKGSGCLNWDIDAGGGTTAGMYNDSFDEFDISDYKGTGSAFVWAYISSVTNLTNYILKVGSSSSAYYSVTVTTNNEGAAFYVGWNLLRFDFSGKSTTGTPDDDACTYVSLYMTKTSAKISETDYRFDHLVMKLGDHYNVVYYSRYPWQSSAGTYLEDATTTTDLLNCETDEYALIIAKTAERMEQHLKNSTKAKENREDYNELKAKYIMDNPSQALPLIQEYYDLGSSHYGTRN